MTPVRLIYVALLISVAGTVDAQSWPTYRHDARRSGVSDQGLHFPLHLIWKRISNQPPQTAWTGPAKWDAYSGNSGLQSMRNFDPCFFVTAADGQLFFGSSVDDAVHALDAATGHEQWTFFTGSAVRFPPTLSDHLAYFGSDDGFVYCCDQTSGELIWKRQAAPERKQVTSNRKIISLWPVRTGVLVQDGKACFGASLVPWKTSYLTRVDAKTGELDTDHGFQCNVKDVTLQGALLASSELIYVPQGRAAPLAFDSTDGTPLGAVGEAGGVFCVLTEDEMLLAGPQDQKSPSQQVRVADARSKQRLATFSGTNRILVAGDKAWIPSAGKLKMLNRSTYIEAQVAAANANKVLNDKSIDDEVVLKQAKDKLSAAIAEQENAWIWETECPNPSDLIKTETAIIVGLDNEVRAYSIDHGNLIWSATVDGVAHGLAVAQGRLFVSTGLGHIFAFGPRR